MFVPLLCSHSCPCTLANWFVTSHWCHQCQLIHTHPFLLEQHYLSGGTYQEGKRAICGSHKQLIAWTCLPVTELVDKPAVKGHHGDKGSLRFLHHQPTHPHIHTPTRIRKEYYKPFSIYNLINNSHTSYIWNIIKPAALVSEESPLFYLLKGPHPKKTYR